MSSGLDLFLPRRDPVFLFTFYTKRTIAFTPVLDILFFLAKSCPGFCFSKNLHAHPNKNQMVAPQTKKKKKKKKKTEKVSDW